MFQPLFLFLNLLLSLGPTAQAQTPADQVVAIALQKNLHQERQWQKLLHFEPGFFGGLATQIDSSEFFFSPNGGQDLEAELKATIQVFWAAPLTPEEKIPQCRYPARYQFLKNHLKDQIKDWPDRACPRYEKFLNALRGESLSLVFSSFYLNNPSSAFGHTFVRINKAPAQDGKRYELLDYGINYAATVNTDNVLVYGFKGMAGLFPGTYTSLPYYYKVREYNNAESRDLWEYELNVTPAQVEMYVAHIWELGPAYFDYWYLTENCSYHMLTSIEAAAPQVDVVSKLKKWIIPSDTVKAVWDSPGLVKSFHYRPSVRTEFFHRYQEMNSAEQKAFHEIFVKNEIEKSITGLSEDSQRKVLDAAMDYMDFKFTSEVAGEGEPALFKRKLLARRSQVSIPTPQLKIDVPIREQPHLGHGSRRWSLGAVASANGDDAAIIGLKHALHDHLDLVTGYPEYAAITFGDFRFSYSRLRQRTELEDLTLVAVTSYSPLSAVSKAFSWRLKIGAEKVKDLNCWGCHGGGLDGSVGYTLKLTEEPLITAFAGIRASLFYIPTGPGNRLQAGAGPAAHVRVRWTDQFITTLDGWYRRNHESDFEIFQEYNFSNQYSFNPTWAVKLVGTDLQYDKKAQAELLYFY